MKHLILTLVAFFTLALHAQEKKVFVEKPGKLASQIKKEESSIKKLKISGDLLNAKDYEALKKCVNLESLDISEIKDVNLGDFYNPFPVLPSVKEIIISNKRTLIIRGDNSYLNGMPDEYKNDIIAFRKIIEEKYYVKNEIIKTTSQKFPSFEKIVIKNAFQPINFSIDVPSLLSIWFPELVISDKIRWSVSLPDGAYIIEKIEKFEDSLPQKYHILTGYYTITNEDLKYFTNLENAIFIALQSFRIDLKETPIQTFTIPKSLRFLDSDAFSFDCRGANPINIIIEESDEPLFICENGIMCEQINKIEFNRPVWIGDKAFFRCKKGKVFFNKDVEYLGKSSFEWGVDEIHFKKCPKKMADICNNETWSKMIERAYIPASEQAKFKAAGASSYFLSIIPTK